MSPLPGSLPTLMIPPGTPWWRVHSAAHGPVWFGPAPGSGPRNRFDAPAGEYRVCYLGDSPEVAVAETIIRQPHTRLVSRTVLETSIASRFPVSRELKLVRLHGPGLLRLGIGAEVAHGYPYDRCQQLALELWQHDDVVDGIEYRSRWDNDRFCFALFDRAADALVAPDHTLSLADPRRTSPILHRYRIGIL